MLHPGGCPPTPARSQDFPLKTGTVTHSRGGRPGRLSPSEGKTLRGGFQCLGAAAPLVLPSPASAHPLEDPGILVLPSRDSAPSFHRYRDLTVPVLLHPPQCHPPPLRCHPSPVAAHPPPPLSVGQDGSEAQQRCQHRGRSPVNRRCRFAGGEPGAAAARQRQRREPAGREELGPAGGGGTRVPRGARRDRSYLRPVTARSSSIAAVPGRETVAGPGTGDRYREAAPVELITPGEKYPRTGDLREASPVPPPQPEAPSRPRFAPPRTCVTAPVSAITSSISAPLREGRWAWPRPGRRARGHAPSPPRRGGMGMASATAVGSA